MVFESADTAVIGFTRGYLAAFFTFVAAFYTVRILWLNHTEHRKFVFAGERYCATWWNHMAFRLFRVLIWMLCLFRWLYPELDQWLGLLPGLQNEMLIASGVVLLTLSFAYVLVVHFSMRLGWRSGIDPDGTPKLITGGFYRFSRNPMFLGVALAQVGFFMALPSVFSLLCLVVGQLALHRQIQAEERHLAEVVPQEYSQYRARVGRWLTLGSRT